MVHWLPIASTDHGQGSLPLCLCLIGGGGGRAGGVSRQNGLFKFEFKLPRRISYDSIVLFLRGASPAKRTATWKEQGER